jgi:phage replication-related protein YjqB (UPF0714/DUF867 family)
MGRHRTEQREELHKLLGRTAGSLHHAIDIASHLDYHGLSEDLLQIHLELARVRADYSAGRVRRPLPGQLEIPTT